MRKGWDLKKLGDVANFSRGLTYSKKDEVDFSSNIVLRSNNVDLNKNQLDFTELRYIDENIKVSSDKKVIKGSLIICTANGSKSHLGKIALIDKDYDFAFGGFMGLLTPTKELDSKYFFYVLTSHSYKKYISELSDGVNINNLKFDDLKEFSFPLPPLPEQKRIVSILDKAFAAINKAKANTEKNLQNAKALFESYLQNVFANPGEDWEEKKLIEVCEFKPQKKEAKDKLKETDLVTFLPMEDLGVLNKQIVGVKERKLKDVTGSYTYFADNDVLMAKITPCFENGKIGIARNLINGIGFGSSEYIVFRTKGKIEPEYLYYFLSRSHIRDEGKKHMSGAVGHKRVTKDWIENYFILFPKSLKSQKDFVQKLDVLSIEIKRLETIYQQKLNDLEELKKSILQKAFAGELTPTKEMAV